MKKDIFKDKTPEDLLKEVAKLKASVASARFASLRGTPLKDLKAYRGDKKTIARILTALNQAQ